MRLRVSRLSFDSARVVKLRPTVLVFLIYRCQCILGAAIILPEFEVSLLGPPKSGGGCCPGIGLRVSICVL